MSSPSFVPMATADEAFAAGVQKGVVMDHKMHYGMGHGLGWLVFLFIVVLLILAAIFWFTKWSWTLNPDGTSNAAKVWFAAVLGAIIVLLIVGAAGAGYSKRGMVAM